MSDTPREQGRGSDGDTPGSAAPTPAAVETTLEDRIRTFADTEYARVVAAVALWSGSIDDAADAVADALGVAWEKIDKGGTVDNLAAYVTTTAMNRVRAGHRRAALFRRNRHLLAVDTETRPAESVATRLDVANALGHLTRRQRTVVALRYGADASIARIAERLDIAPGTVKATLHQARAAVAAHLGERST